MSNKKYPLQQNTPIKQPIKEIRSTSLSAHLEKIKERVFSKRFSKQDNHNLKVYSPCRFYQHSQSQGKNKNMLALEQMISREMDRRQKMKTIKEKCQKDSVSKYMFMAEGRASREPNKHEQEKTNKKINKTLEFAMMKYKRRKWFTEPYQITNNGKHRRWQTEIVRKQHQMQSQLEKLIQRERQLQKLVVQPKDIRIVGLQSSSSNHKLPKIAKKDLTCENVYKHEKRYSIHLSFVQKKPIDIGDDCLLQKEILCGWQIPTQKDQDNLCF